jgi:hypothetical protein
MLSQELFLITLADSHVLLLELPRSGIRLHRVDGQHILNRAVAFGTDVHMGFLFDLVCKGGDFAGHASFSFLIHIGVNS